MRKRRWARLKTDIEFINPNICFCAPDIPDPDPQVGASMMANADISKEMAQVARDTLAWNKERAAKQDPLIDKVVQQQIASADTNADRATEQWNIYKNLFAPTEARMVEEANNFDSPERKERMAGEAGADTTRAYQAMQDQQARAMGRLGVNPNSGRFAALNNEMGLAQAKDTAGAMNKARRDTEMQGIALRTGAAQLGRNMPNTGIAADSLALNGGSQAVGNMAAGANINNAANSSAAQWFGGAQAGNSSAGNLGLGLYQGQLQGAQMKQDAMSGIGSLVGSLAGAGAIAF